MSDLFSNEVDVAPNRQRVWPIVAALVGVGLVFGGIASVVVTGGVNVWSVLAPVFGAAPVPELGAVESASGIMLPAGTKVEQPRDDSVYVIGQVRLPEGTGNPLEADFVEIVDIPRHTLEVWGADLGNPQYYIGAEGRTALTGTHDGERVIVFYERP